MNKLFYVFLMFSMPFTSCNNTGNENANTLDKTGMEQNADTNAIPKLDSLLVLPMVTASKYDGPRLTLSKAKEVLYQYYFKNGFLIEDDLKGAVSGKDTGKFEVRFDTAYFVNINHSRRTDAIVEYWISSQSRSGNCIQPHKATIIDDHDGYKVTNVDFIPENYVIDSVKTIECETVIYGYDYDCASHTVLKKLRLTIN